MPRLADLKPGDRLMWLYDDGWHGSIIYADVVHVNRVTVTVRCEDGSLRRIDPGYAERKLTDAEKLETQEFFKGETG